MSYRILGQGKPVRLFVAGLHGDEWKDTSDILENIEAPQQGTLAVIPLVNNGNYISTLDDRYFSDIGIPIIEAVEELEPDVYIEIHSYSAENLEDLTGANRLKRIGVPAFSRLDHDVLLGSVAPYIRRKYFPQDALCLTFEIQKENPASKEYARKIINRMKEFTTRDEFLNCMLEKYPEQARKAIDDYKKFYGLSDDEL
ncbi:DUF2119 domain-containing protein [Methanolobus sediminis]|uniref:DUF2119 domain-containing protein n=1 Tax=Methanolobus sediminis TaxID=3072978 RepID=A0AA51UJV8_9EURY|nr:DUF2119 domain-containing protein [Methanolobus sediminis]WMW24724.1 DUF2119 domain-containing protein [Methanolobus sediminis]